MILLLAHKHIVMISTKTLMDVGDQVVKRKKKHINLKELAGFVQNKLSGNGQMKQYRWLHACAIKRIYVAS